jgi:hypothetical protein
MTSPTKEKNDENPQAEADKVRIDRISKQAENFKESTDKIRQRADTTAKALGLLGTTVLTASGIAEFGDIFPLSPTESLDWLYVSLSIGSFLAIAGALAYFTWQLWKVNLPVVTSSLPSRMQSISSSEERLVEEIYGRTAALNRAKNLSALEARAQRLQRIGGDERPDLTVEANSILTVVSEAQNRAAHAVVRTRAVKAVGGLRALTVYAVLAVGVVSFAVSSDWLESKRADDIKVATACGDAKKAGVSMDPLTICSAYFPKSDITEPPPPKTFVATEQVAELGRALEECRAAEVRGTPPPPPGACNALAAAVAALVPQR